MVDLFTFENIANLGVLIFLQAVLGFDNLLYISIESQRAPKEYQKSVRFLGYHHCRWASDCSAFYHDFS